MSRKGHREPTQSEKEHAYVMHNKREKGEKIAGDLAEDLEYAGEHGDVKKRRQEWNAEHLRGRGGTRAPKATDEAPDEREPTND